MARLKQYTETLEFREYHGHRVLLPSELDLAIKRLTRASQDEELDRLETQPEPGEIKKARTLLVSASEAARPALEAKLAAYETRKAAEQEGWLTALWRTDRTLQKMEQLVDGKPDALGGESVSQRFELREFSDGEARQTDEEHSELRENEAGEARKVILLDARNRALLDVVLLGEWLPTDEVQLHLRQAAAEELDPDYVLAAPRQTRHFTDVVDGQPQAREYTLVTAPAAEELQKTICQTLIERMWAKNTMASELAGFFGPVPRPLRLTSPSPTS
jgi:hypothetical protein